VRQPFTHAARFGLALAVASASLASPTSTTAGDGLRELSRRLEQGDVAAIEEILARTRPATNGGDPTLDRLDRLRAEVEMLRARRAAKPSLFPPTARDFAAPPAQLEPSGSRVDALRESRAWLRAGNARRALAALDVQGEERLFLEARALESLGRTREAIEIHERLAREAGSTFARARASADAEHLKWVEQRRVAREQRP
jgi:hypothetical protein